MNFEYTGSDNIKRALDRLLEYMGPDRISKKPRPRVTIHRVFDDTAVRGTVDILEDMFLYNRMRTKFGVPVYYFKHINYQRLPEVCLIDNIVKIIIHLEEEWPID